MSEKTFELNEGSFVSSLQCSLETRIKDYAEKIAEEMVSDYSNKLKKRMSDLLASLSIELLRMVTIERMGSELVIRVQTEWSKP